MSKRRRIVAVSAGLGLIATAAGLGAMALPEQSKQAKMAEPDVTGLLRERSPGLRLAGAETSKNAAVPMSAILPISAPRPQSVSGGPAAPIKIAMLSPGVVPVAAAPAAAGPAAIGVAAAPVPPSAIAPAVGAAVPVAAVVPVAAASVSSGIGAAALLPIIPAAFAIGSGGGGSSGGITSAVPEPQTWMMMITGFGLLGMALRRRRRQDRSFGRPVAQAA